MRHDESHLQKACVRWFRYAYPKYDRLLFAVPNGGARNKTEAAILKAEGVVAGVADLILLLPNRDYHCLALELKTPKGRQSDSQKQWQATLQEHGGNYAVIRSKEQFIATITEYLSNL